MLTVGSLFSGIGGMDRGLELAGCVIEWQAEMEFDSDGKPLARQANQELLARRFPGVPQYGDVRTVHDAPAVDVLCGGFPCQDLSVAGSRAGLAGGRSGLFHEFMRIAAALRPRWVVVENVPGLLSSQAGRDMGIVLGVLADLGYGWCYRVLDAQYFGVAQRRRRVFIVGCLGDAARAAQVLLEPESCDGDSPPSREAGEDLAGTLGGGTPGGGPRNDTDRMTFVAGTLRSHPRPGSNAVGALAFMWQAAGDDSASGAWEEDFTPTMPANQTIAVAYAITENLRAELRLTPYANAVTAGGGKPGQGYQAVMEGMAVRRLTPLECERLQGFPDGWTEGFPDSTRYRMLGNAVCVPVAAWIGRRLALIEALERAA